MKKKRANLTKSNKIHCKYEAKSKKKTLYPFFINSFNNQIAENPFMKISQQTSQ